MNPLLAPSPLPFGFPDFAAIREEHFAEAFDVAMAEQRAEIAAITALPGPPTFDDTVVALERSGATLRRVSAVFFVLVGSLSHAGYPRDRGPGRAAARRARRRDHPGPGPVRPARRAARRPRRARPGPRVAASAGTPPPRRGPGRRAPRPRRAGAAARAERRAVGAVHGVRRPAARRHQRRGRASSTTPRGSTGSRRTRSPPPRGRPRSAGIPAATCSRSCCPRTSPPSPRSPTGRCGSSCSGRRSRAGRGAPRTTPATSSGGSPRCVPSGRGCSATRTTRRGSIEVGTAATVEVVEKMLAALVPPAVRNAEAEAAELAAAAGHPIEPWDRAFHAERRPPRPVLRHRGAAPVPRAGAGAARRRVRRGGRALRAAVHRAPRPAAVPPGRAGVST